MPEQQFKGVITMSVQHPELSIILPAYNESAGLAHAVRLYLAELTSVGLEDFEIIVVNDASKDNTGAIAEQLEQEDSRIRVLHHERNQGQAAAILNGFRVARGEVLTHNGVDLPFHPGDTLGPLMQIREGADVVVVERRNRKAYGWYRKVISWCNIALVKTLFRTPFRDHNFVQFYRRHVLETVPVLTKGVSTVTPELIFRARRTGFRVEGTITDYHERRTAKSTVTWRKIVQTTWETLRLWRLLGQQGAPVLSASSPNPATLSPMAAPLLESRS